MKVIEINDGFLIPSELEDLQDSQAQSHTKLLP